jgi:hypothetical protein
MPMSDFFRTFPKLAESELRNFTIGRGTGSELPAGRYGFIEAYCDKKGSATPVGRSRNRGG